MTILESVLDVFDAISTWIVGAVQNVMPMFYVAESGLTFLGVLAVSGLAISVIFLIIGVIQNFLHFRG